ncbi:MAG: DNA-directed RNA polymerase subunit alpha [Fibrobacteres bacterium]|nr:DNA-directed RNA polymerase subunit alpha [Fibrobacterota bacterium]
MKWKALHMPKGIVKEKGDSKYGKFVIEPFERGWGITVGNALRRVLLSSLQGAAVVSVKSEGVQHEFSTLEGVKEDFSEIILNIKQLRVKLLSDEDATLRLDISGEGEVRGEHIEANPDVQILNPELHIATLGKNGSLTIEMRVSDGRGYVISDELKREDDPIGVIPIDANFSPVTKVAYEVSDTRVGQRTDFNRLEMDVWTDGSIDPEDAMAYGAKLLVDHLEMFINFEGDLEAAEEVVKDEEKERIRQLLKMRVDELELSVRSSNCLRCANIHTIADLVRNQESEMLKYKNFGRKSLIELNEVLSNMGLSFGMDVDYYLGDEK